MSEATGEHGRADQDTQKQMQVVVVEDHVWRAKHMLYDLHELASVPPTHSNFKSKDMQRGNVLQMKTLNCIQQLQEAIVGLKTATIRVSNAVA